MPSDSVRMKSLPVIVTAEASFYIVMRSLSMDIFAEKNKIMATSDLSFRKEGDRYKATFVSAGKQTVQVERKEKGGFDIMVNLDGMTETGASYQFPFYNSTNMVFEVETQQGVNVSLYSDSEVTAAKVLTE